MSSKIKLQTSEIRDQRSSFAAGQKFFAEFLKSEYSDENILFWQACEELKREKNAEKIEEKVRLCHFILNAHLPPVRECLKAASSLHKFEIGVIVSSFRVPFLPKAGIEHVK